MAACIWLALRLYRARRRGRPFRRALDALDTLLIASRGHELSPQAYADSVNDLLKRALIYGARRHDAAPLTGAAWLAYLDGFVASDAFSNGPGAALGNQRFAPGFDADPGALHAVAREVLRAVARRAPR